MDVGVVLVAFLSLASLALYVWMLLCLNDCRWYLARICKYLRDADDRQEEEALAKRQAAGRARLPKRSEVV